MIKDTRRNLSVAAVSVAFFLSGCSDDWAERGYDDGYVIGWNSVCAKNASNLIYGEWDNEEYTVNYHNGEQDGKHDAREKGC